MLEIKFVTKDFPLPIAEQKVSITTVTNKESEDIGNTEYPIGVHYIQVIDRSGSMSGSLSKLIKHVIDTAGSLRIGDYLSVLWYSGSGQNDVIFKMYKITGNDHSIISGLISKYNYTVGCTVFSETLKRINTIVDETENLVSGTVITWFTDGQLMPDHQSFSAEKQEVLFLAETIGKNPTVLALDTIGYGSYYDRLLLEEMSGKSQFGTFTHNSDISSYTATFAAGVEKVKGLVPVGTIKVSNPGNAEVMFLSDKGMFSSNESEFVIRSLSKRDNKIVLFGEGSEIKVTVGGVETVISNKAKHYSVEPRSVDKVLYGIACKFFQTGRRDDAMDIYCDVLRDKNIADSVLRAFSVEELGNLVNTLYMAYKEADCRNAGTITDDAAYSAAGPNFFELLNILTKHNALLDVSHLKKNYNKVGPGKVGQIKLFTEDKTHRILKAAEDIAFAKDKLNVYVNAEIKGSIQLLPKQAKAVGLNESIDCVRFKSYNLIVDGLYNVDSILVKFNSKDEYDAAKVMLTLDGYEFEYPLDNDVQELLISLHNLPIANRAMSKNSKYFAPFVTIIGNEAKLACEQKVINYFIKSKESVTKVLTEAEKQYTPEQLDVLAAHGLDRQLRYNEVGGKVDKEAMDFIMVRSMEFDMEGFATIPSIPDVLKYQEKHSKPSEIKEMMYEMYSHYVTLDVPTLREALRNVKNELNYNRSILAALKFIKASTGGWFADLPLIEGETKYKKDGALVTVKYTKTGISIAV